MINQEGQTSRCGVHPMVSVAEMQPQVRLDLYQDMLLVTKTFPRTWCWARERPGLGFGNGMTIGPHNGVTTRNIHFYDEQLSSLKEPNSS